MAYNSHFSREEAAILKTLGYSDLFDFPLTKEELWRFLLAEISITRDAFEHALQVLCEKKKIIRIFTGTEYYCLPRREFLVAQRVHNLAEVTKKYQIAHRAARFLSYIPSISFIGVSGSLAIRNVDPSDDIDLFIITKKNTLFITRFWILVVLETLRLRRVKHEKHPADKVCVNLLIDERNVSWDKSKRDVFVAHEIVQLVPLFERSNMYHHFLAHNIWVQQFLPNALRKERSMEAVSGQRQYYTLSFFSVVLAGYLAELLARWIQKAVMHREKTDTSVSNTILAFHPNDYRVKTLKKLRRKYQQLGLLTNI